MTRDDFLFAGLKLIAVWTGVLAFRQLLALISTFPVYLLASRVDALLTSSRDGIPPLSTGDILNLLSNQAISTGIQFLGLAGMALFLLLKTSAVANWLVRSESGSDAA